MARSKSKKAEQAKETTWADVQEASAAAQEEEQAEDEDQDDDDGPDGVIHDGGGPVYLEPLTAEQRAAAGEKLARALAELEEAEADAKETIKELREDLKARRDGITRLRNEVLKGVREVPAQAVLPGVTPEAA